MFTPEMMKHIVQCTNVRVELIKNNQYPKPGLTKVWSPKWADKCQPLTETRLMLWIVVYICRGITRVKEGHMWETGNLTSTPGIQWIMPSTKILLRPHSPRPPSPRSRRGKITKILFDEPVYIREGGEGGRGESGLRIDAPVYIRE